MGKTRGRIHIYIAFYCWFVPSKNVCEGPSLVKIRQLKRSLPVIVYFLNKEAINYLLFCIINATK